MPRHIVLLPHLLVPRPPSTERYVSHGGGNPEYPDRDRRKHGERIGKAYDRALENVERTIAQYPPEVMKNSRGFYLTFELREQSHGILKTLDAGGLELISVSLDEETNHLRVVVFIPKEKKDRISKKIRQYLDKDTKAKLRQDGTTSEPQPLNKSFVESVEGIAPTTMRALWQDSEDSFPSKEDGALWWEVWVIESEAETFQSTVAEVDAQCAENSIVFPDRRVFLVRADVQRMERLLWQAGAIAELRKYNAPSHFVGLEQAEQVEQTDELLARTSWPALDAPTVCLLDTGVNNKHHLLSKVLADEDRHTYDPDWPKGETGSNIHGTKMAGIAIYGDLHKALKHREPLAVEHRLESVRILPPHGENDPELYGYITSESVSRVEIAKPDLKRNYCMAVTDEGQCERGDPSSWSATVDKICFGAQDGSDTMRRNRRLMFVSAGNVRDSQDYTVGDYINKNKVSQVESPAQAWNAVTVGAYTEKSVINDPGYPGWQALAEKGDLSPWSRSSSVWKGQWPIKPEIVLEGGNLAKSPSTTEWSQVDDLALLTTSHDFANRQFDIIDGTSAATAQAARMAAIIQGQYPDYWPETVRGLLIHSAEWTDAMKKRIPQSSRTEKEATIRLFGYGVPSIDRALWSARNALTLVAQCDIQPYEKGSGDGRMKELHMHKLPWPREILIGLEEEKVSLRVTLSYFIEPNPAARGYSDRYRYMSHGLRFKVKQASESEENFEKRINRAMREEGEDFRSGPSDTSWNMGPKMRDKGSIHSDVWTGTAADLATRDIFAVHPVGGWWKTLSRQRRWNEKTRYALIVSLETEKVDVDIYTPISNLVAQETEISDE